MRYSLALALAVAASAAHLDPQGRSLQTDSTGLKPVSISKGLDSPALSQDVTHKAQHTIDDHSRYPDVEPSAEKQKRVPLENTSTKMRRVVVSPGHLSARHADIKVAANQDNMKKAVSQDRTNVAPVAVQRPRQLRKLSSKVDPEQAIENWPSSESKDASQSKLSNIASSLTESARSRLESARPEVVSGQDAAKPVPGDTGLLTQTPQSGNKITIIGADSHETDSKRHGGGNN